MEDDIVEAILTKLSTVRLVGYSLELLSNEEYDLLEQELCDIVEKYLRKDNS